MNMISPILAADPVLSRTEVAGIVALAARTVPLLWPLDSAIAVNPLAGFEDLPFPQGVRSAAERFGARESLPLSAWRKLHADGHIDEKALRDAAIARLGGVYDATSRVAPGVSRLDLLMARLLELPAEPARAKAATVTPDAAFIAKWCAAFFDQGLAASAMPHRELGLYRAVLALAGHDPQFADLTGHAGSRLLLAVPRDPLEAIAEGLTALEIHEGGEVDYLASLVARLPGWAGHIRWRSEHADREFSTGAPASMADLLALWMLLARAGALSPAATVASADPKPALLDKFAIPAERLEATPAAAPGIAAVSSIGDGELGAIFMTAAEWTYANATLPLLQNVARARRVEETPDAQLVFCIDVRSEPFRRALESQGRYQTLGYAGFFGLPVAVHRAGEERRRRLLPVLLGPQHDVAEGPATGREEDAVRLLRASAAEEQIAGLFASAKAGSATAFATAEAVGPLAGLTMAARTVAPRLVARIASALKPERDEVLAPRLDPAEGHAHHRPFTLEEKIGYAGALFRLTGLPSETARLVVLVGHGGSAVNNPYAAALDCGACGGHRGGSNARILTAMLNDPAVREGLAAQGIAIPETTVFIAAEHNTTTDEVAIFDQGRVPDSHSADLAALKRDLERAGAANREVRARKLRRSADDLITGALHWGEVRPEWGLARNAAFIVGPRWLTREIDLDGRAFLHSYDWTADADGTALTTILTAPMVVAQWINCQYLFSTVDNERYGSGDKTTQNVVGGLGVVQGNGGDLKVGLPRQSLFEDDGTPYHIPQRLLTVVLAPLPVVEKVVADNDILERLFGNGWVSLVVIDPESGKALRWRRGGHSHSEGSAPLSAT